MRDKAKVKIASWRSLVCPVLLCVPFFADPSIVWGESKQTNHGVYLTPLPFQFCMHSGSLPIVYHCLQRKSPMISLLYGTIELAGTRHDGRHLAASLYLPLLLAVPW